MVPPLLFLSAPCVVRAHRRACARMSARCTRVTCMGISDNPSRRPAQMLRPALAALCVSLSLLMPCHARARVAAQDNRSDVEAAVLTLGAVMLGGGLMRVVVQGGRDREKERERVQKECQRLQEEELERSRRRQRRELESVGEQDGDLMEQLRKRVEQVGSGTGEEEKGDEAAHGNGPVGGAVLEREREEEEEEEEEEEKEEKDAPSEKDLEMLRRMWKMTEGGEKGDIDAGKK